MSSTPQKKKLSAEEEAAALVQRATEEREKLFQRYDRGREPGAEIDPWEDPGWEVYHQTDRYGFIHDQRLPQRPNPHEQRAKEIELERVKKWLKMLDKWQAKDTQEKVRRRVFKGVPDKLRSKVWSRLLNLDQVMRDQKGVYERMLRQARTWGTEARQIDSDVNRQFREHLFYRERYSIKQRSLFNVLTAYSMYNMEVGYCQGMSGVAGVLLMYLDEEEAFWALSTLLSDKRYAMHGLYIEGFPKLTRFLGHHDKIVAKFLPKLKKHFDQFSLDAILYALKWFFVVFVERIPFSLCLRVWDIFLLEGDKVITAMAYTILRLHRNRLLKLRDMDAVVQYIQVQLQKDFGYDEDHVIKALEQSMEELRKAKMDVPPPPGDNELPKGPFGVFKAPSFEEQIGRRKSMFTEKEREVTETVKLKRENTEREINAEINNNEGAGKLPGTVIGSNGHLNSVHMAESEDGGSLLGSSRKSLADTSVTSTADLSIFSGGQDGHTTNNTNNNNSIHSNPLFDQDDPIEGHALVEEDEQSSPGSAYCSMSIATTPRPPSAMRITPTPRNVSPQDIVRIYVPPPPPEELLYDRPSDLRLNAALSSESGKSPESDCRTIIQRTPTELPGSVSTATITSHSVQRFRGREEGESLDRTLRDLALYSSQGSLRGGGDAHSTSSSRRGSMSRKSTMLVDPELAPECPHIRIDSRKNSLLSQHRNSFGEVNSDGTSSVVVHGEYEAIMARANKERPKKPPRIMTSFEKLAQLNDTFYFGGAKGRGGGNGEDENEEGEKVIKKARQKSDDEGFSYSFQAMRGGGGGDEGGKSRTKSDYNIQYKARGEVETLSAGGGGGGNGETVMKNKKQYDRFFTPDESEEDDEDEEEGNMSNNKVGGDEKRGNKKGPPHHLHHLHHHHQRRNEGNSSSSPSSSSKSLLTTPVNERQPLIMAEDDHQGEMHRHHLVKEYKFKHSVGGGNKRRVKHLTTDEDEDGYDDEEEEEEDHLYSGLESKETPLSSPTEVAVKGKGGGGAYYAHRASSYIPIMQQEEEDDPGEQLRMTKSTTEHSMGRISIRINEKKQ